MLDNNIQPFLISYSCQVWTCISLPNNTGNEGCHHQCAVYANWK